jgi:hypothetical protein
MSDERELRRLSALIRDRVSSERSDCPPVEVLVAAATRGDGKAHRMPLLEHVATCLACRKDFDLLRTVVEAGGGRRRWLRFGIPLAAAAALIFAVSSPWRPGRALLRAPVPEVGLHPSIAATDSVRLVWASVTQAVRYQVELFSLAGLLLASTETRDTTFTIAWDEANRAADVRWMVRAYLPDGRTFESEASPLRRSR